MPQRETGIIIKEHSNQRHQNLRLISIARQDLKTVEGNEVVTLNPLYVASHNKPDYSSVLKLAVLNSIKGFPASRNI